MGSRIEAIFGGILVLFVIVAAVVAILSFPNRGAKPKAVADAGDPIAQIQEQLADDKPGRLICKCYDAGFTLAGTNVSVLSSEYRTGYEQCRALGAQQGASAWTDGWNARLSAKPYEASCRSYIRAKGY